MTNIGPDASARYPMPQHQKLVFLKNIITNPNIQVGDFTYYDDFTDPLNFERNVLYHFDFVGDKLIIGKFCAIASGAKFIMNGANHETTPISSYPLNQFLPAYIIKLKTTLIGAAPLSTIEFDGR